jgi:anthranilate phosphoribosyltransferase
MLRPIAETLSALGVERALVVHGSGLDEIALHGFTQAVALSDGSLEEIEITPEEAGLRRAPVEHVAGGSPEENAVRLRAILSNRGRSTNIDIVALNTAALLLTAGLAGNLRQGVAMALDAIQSGRAVRLLDDFIEASRA